jgi:cyclic pyranopterin monophosphate synthase
MRKLSEEGSGPDSLSHIDESGAARMVDVGKKDETVRQARAEAWVSMSPKTLEFMTSGSLPKGDVFATARVAGIAAAKRTAELIPLCHPIRLDSVDVDFHVDPGSSRVRVDVLARATDRTGVEMEALVAAGIASLAIYDMCKAVERGVEVTSLRLVSKSGGDSGTWEREE